MTVSLPCKGGSFFEVRPAAEGTAPSLTGISIGLTAGPTRAWIDPVRYLANASTGQLGALIADRLAALGAEVTVILGPGAVRPENPSIHLIPIETPDELLRTLQSLAVSMEGGCIRYWIHAMAVLDFVPAVMSEEKIPSDRGEWSLPLKPTPKVIEHMKVLFPHAGLIGFKLISSCDPDQLRQAAIRLAEAAGCDLVVANPSPFDNSRVHRAWFWERGCSSWRGPADGKPAIADTIVAWIEEQQRGGAIPHV